MRKANCSTYTLTGHPLAVSAVGGGWIPNTYRLSDTDMVDKILIFLTVVSLAGVLITWLYTTYHWYQTFGNARPGMGLKAYFNPLGLFDPSHFTEEGNYHRVRTLIGMLLSMFFCLSAVLFRHLH